MDSEILKARSKNLAYEVTSLARCEDEPIATCGAIQPSGLTVVVDARTLEVRALSRNWGDVLPGVKAEALLGKPLGSLVEVEGADPISGEEFCRWIENGKARISLRGSAVKVSPGSCHRQGRHFIMEFEFAAEGEAAYPVTGLRDLVQGLKDVPDIASACQQTAEAIKGLSGFDRVMIYRFDAHWNGEVLAEAKESSLEPFLGLRYPASDIPPQARDLFFRNHSRMIVDVSAEPSPILTQGFHPGEIDLSGSILRAVSPIHIQYLVNMGVKASFSAPIRVNDKLWGLIACHHYAASRHPHHEVRSAFELAGQIVSGKINDLVARRRLQIKNETLIFTQNLLTQVASGADPIESFSSDARSLLSLTDSRAAYVRFGDREIVLGEAPSPETIAQVRARLKRVESLSIWQSDSLVRDVGGALDPKAAGALAVPFSLGFEDCLIWFRPEEIQEVRWGGKPKQKEAFNPNSIDRLVPRLSFAEWREKLENHSRPWGDGEEECAQFFLFGFVQGIFNKAQALSQAYQELERVAKAKDEFIGTISHELRTPLGIIIGWIEILKEHPQSSSEARDAVEIIDRNARMQVALINDLLDVSRIVAGKLRLDPRPNVDLVPILADLVEGLRPTAAAKSISLTWDPPPQAELTVDPDRLRQMVWNLLTNAIKFTPKGGHVRLSLERERSAVRILVEDDGIGIDPLKLSAVFDRFMQVNAADAKRGGLGLGLSIVKALAELHGGRVEAQSEGMGRGTRFTIVLPIYALRLDEDSPPESARPEMRRSTKLEGLRVLIAEDQADSLRALSILIERNGATVVGVENGAAALAALRGGSFDLILSDINMPEVDGYGFIRQWRGEEQKFNIPQIPAVALTAYASSKDRTKALAAGFQSHIPKPVDRDELMAVIDSLGLLKKR